jgi:bifunctional non-homologous end joining protein LigD
VAEIAAGTDIWHSGGKSGRAKRKAGRTAKFQPPQLATLVDAVPTGNDWLHEYKYDGYRLLCDRGRGSDRLHPQGPRLERQIPFDRRAAKLPPAA